jgi:molecular chaperone GrpE
VPIAPIQPDPGAEEARPETDPAATTQEMEAEADGSAEPAEPGAPDVEEPDVEEPDAGEPDVEEPDVEPEVPRPYVNPLVEALRSELAERDQQLRSYITAYKEATADMERERERVARQRETVLDRERMELAGRFLPVLDNLGRSLTNCTPASDPADVARGLQLVRDGFVSALAELGVEPIDALGAIFDAGLHEATAMIPASGKQSDQEIIFEELPGYTFRGKLLRATRVVVASKPD